MSYKTSAILTLLLIGGAVTANAQQEGISSDEYILSQEFVEAEVVRVYPPARTITVRGTNRGETRQFVIPEGARITIRGRQARLRDIRRGDIVMLAMTPKSERIVVERIRVPVTDKSLDQRRAEPAPAAAMPTALPKTASLLPALFGSGCLALVGAALLRHRRTRRS